MKEEHQILLQFHSSPESFAGEIAFRNSMRQAGFAEPEIDGMILRAFHRRRLFRQFVVIGLMLVSTPLLVRYLAFGVSTSFWTVALFIVGVFVAALVCASYRAGVLSSNPEEWERTRGTTWTGDWQRRI